MATLFIMAGCPGSGKSTYAKNYLSSASYISRDLIRFSLVSENEEYFSKEDQVFRAFISNIKNELNKNHDVVADATHLNFKSRAKLFSNLQINKEKDNIVIIFLDTPLEICLKRNKNRLGTRAYVPDNVIKNMYSSIEKPNFKEYNGIIDEIHIIKMKGDNK